MTGDIHTCHAECQKPFCVLCRENESLKSQLEETRPMRLATELVKLKKELSDAQAVIASLRAVLEATLIKVDWNSDEFHDVKQYAETRKLIMDALTKLESQGGGDGAQSEANCTPIPCNKRYRCDIHAGGSQHPNKAEALDMLLKEAGLEAARPVGCEGES